MKIKFKNTGKILKSAFTNWFSKEVKEIHGFDIKNPPKGPLPELIVDSSEEIYQV